MLASIHDIVVLVAQPGAAALLLHRRGIRISRAHAQLRDALVPILGGTLGIELRFLQQPPVGLIRRCQLRLLVRREAGRKHGHHAPVWRVSRVVG